MAVTSDKPGPYTSPQVVIDLIERHRNRGLPSPVDNDVLARAGVSDSLIPRTLQSLQTLELIDDKGQLTEIFEKIRTASETDYKNQMQQWLNDVYADVLSYVDPADDDETRIRDAFRSYKPIGQQNRMVSLFINLFIAAGLREEKITKPQKPRTSKKLVLKKRVSATTAKSNTGIIPQSLGVPPAIAGLLQSLPQEGHSWPQERRDKFVETFSSILDFCYSIKEEPDPEDCEDGDLS